MLRKQLMGLGTTIVKLLFWLKIHWLIHIFKFISQCIFNQKSSFTMVVPNPISCFLSIKDLKGNDLLNVYTKINLCK